MSDLSFLWKLRKARMIGLQLISARASVGDATILHIHPEKLETLVTEE